MQLPEDMAYADQLSPLLAAAGWQDVAVLAIVVMAAVYLTRSIWRTLAGGAGKGCGTCAKCPTGDEKQPQQLVELRAPRKGASFRR